MIGQHTYDDVRKSIKSLIDYPLPEWHVTKISAENALNHLDQYEREGRPVPKILTEDDGVTLTWEAGWWKIYQHFDAEEMTDEIYVIWRGLSNVEPSDSRTA